MAEIDAESEEEDEGEKVVRRIPKGDTLRELYLKSGNQCAFPDCTRLMIDSEGDFIGQLCHIEAAEKGGERFNKNQTNEERRHFSNLMLLCYEHHVKTNDVDTYNVSVLQEMKRIHEAKFTDIASAIGIAIVDKGHSIALEQPKTLQRMHDTLKWGLEADELSISRESMAAFTLKIQRLPIRTRQVLVVIVSRLQRNPRPNDWYVFDDRVLFREIAEATNLADHVLVEHVEILTKYKVGVLEGEPSRAIRLYRSDTDWDYCGDLNEFCRRTGEPLRSLLVDLKFDLLD
jgi:hypothetical protein